MSTHSPALDDALALLRRAPLAPAELRPKIDGDLEWVEPHAIPELLLTDAMLRLWTVEVALGTKRRAPAVARFLVHPGCPLAMSARAHLEVRGLGWCRPAAYHARVAAHEGEEGWTLLARLALSKFSHHGTFLP